MKLSNTFALAVLLVGAHWQHVLAQPRADGSLFEAIKNSQLHSVTDYLSRGGNPNAAIPDSPLGNAPLLRVAVAANREEITVALLQAGGRLDQAGVGLGDIGAAGMDRALRYILADAKTQSSADIKTALDIAVTLGHYDCVTVLLEFIKQSNLAIQDVTANALYLAIGRDDIARLLLDNGAIASSDVLRAAAQWSSPGLMQYILRLGANPLERYRNPTSRSNAENSAYSVIDFVWDGYLDGTPVQRQAARYKLYILLELGAHSERVDESVAANFQEILPPFASMASRLRAAAQMGFYDAVEAIIADPNSRDPMAMRTATIVALQSHWDDIARLLLESGAPPDGGPLHVAVKASTPGMVRYLLQLGADPNEILEGYTPSQYWLSDNPARPLPPAGRTTSKPENLFELIKGGADICVLVEHRELLEDQAFSYDILRNSAPECWPGQR